MGTEFADFQMFHILGNLHCAIEELMVPYPKAFFKHFFELGYKTQPRQYEMKIFFVFAF